MEVFVSNIDVTDEEETDNTEHEITESVKYNSSNKKEIEKNGPTKNINLDNEETISFLLGNDCDDKFENMLIKETMNNNINNNNVECIFRLRLLDFVELFINRTVELYKLSIFISPLYM